MHLFKRLKWRLSPQNDFEKSASEYQRKRNFMHNHTICKAPTTNMYIGHHGVVKACCYNSIHSLGIWPIKTLTEIWNSDKANELRTSLSDYDLSKGCSICYQQLMAQNYDAFKATQFDQHKKNRNKFPSVIEFELDNKCNLACTMCNEDFSSVIASRKGITRYQSPYNEDFIEQLKPFIPHLKEAKFYGGEPFMIKIYYVIWDLIHQLNPQCSINIQTNGTIIHDRVKNLLKRKNLNFNISIDSLQKENYERIRDGASFQETMENLQLFIDYAKKNKTYLGISACMMQSTVHEAPDFISFCNRNGIQIYFHTVVHPEQESIQNMEISELTAIYDLLSSVEFTSTNTVHQKNITHYQDFVKQIKYWLDQKNTGKTAWELKPVQSWEDFFDRVQSACISVYGEKTGKQKSQNLKTNIETIIQKGLIKDESAIFQKIVHEDLSSSIHRIVDLSEEELIQIIV